MSSLYASYPLDLTGTATSNSVSFAVQLGSGTVNRAFAFPDGPFYADSFKLYESNSPSKALVRGEDYQLILYDEVLAKMAKNQEIAHGVVVFNTAISENVKGSAQIVGGQFGQSVTAIKQAIDALNLDDRSIDFSDLDNVPEEYVAAPSYTDIGNIYGFEFIISVLNELVEATKNGTKQEITQLTEQVNSVKTALNEALNEHVNAKGNVHTVTPAQLGVPTKTQQNEAIQNALTQIAKLGDRIGDIENLNTTQNNRLTAIENSITAVAKTIAAISKTEQANASAISELNTRMAEEESLGKQRDERMDGLETRIASLESDLKETKQRVSSLENADKALGERIDATNEDLAQLRSDFDNQAADDDPFPQYLNRNTGGTVHADVKIEGYLDATTDVRSKV